MRTYLHANVLVALFTADARSDRADAALRGSDPLLVVSDLAGAEFSAAVARLVRTRIYAEDDAGTAFARFDTWLARATEHVETLAVDLVAVTALVRRLDVTLTAPDAVHLAIVGRVDAALLTFDVKMAHAARTLGIRLAPVIGRPASSP